MYKLRGATGALLLLVSGILVSLCLPYKREEYTGLLSDYGHKFSQSVLAHTPSSAFSASSRPSQGLIGGFNNALQSCRITDLPNDPLVKEYGQNNIRLSRTYEGSGTRVRKVMEKALRGERIKIAVIGGSVSAVSACA
jgi:hypothetical protein